MTPHRRPVPWRIRRSVAAHNLRAAFFACPCCEALRLEPFLSFYAATLGATMLLPYETFATSPLYITMRGLMPEDAWGALFVAGAIAKFFGFAFSFNRIRFVGSLALTFAFAFMAIAFNSTHTARLSLGGPITVLLFAAQFYTTARVSRSPFAPSPLRRRSDAGKV